ncbi:MAG: hypothetical protein OFPII_18880 [Osedax symbiont Rs1]|nr:MAG: hypothetical protein OFPII_18880 [Osedax symbiont Rs1]
MSSLKIRWKLNYFDDYFCFSKRNHLNPAVLRVKYATF